DQLRTGVSSSSGAAGVGADRNAAAAPGPASGSSAPTVLMTGTDYTAQTLDTLAARARALHQPGPLTPLHGTTGAEGNGLAAGSLQRLQGTDALRTCLDLVAAAHHGTPELVDYARYQGNPAIVVVLTGPGTGELVVVGPDCGLPGSGTDEIYAAPVR
ncbi:MAG TPA: hypothetical protein VJT31_27890, partial [Rugosimonospora sp.]|nr:hypothetical protein [Rugosimonospora sp.]